MVAFIVSRKDIAYVFCILFKKNFLFIMGTQKSSIFLVFTFPLLEKECAETSCY